ncbi:MAG: DNA-directed RNA polymerase subunit beta', partial [Rhodococcus sp. (in: high G+C Gram-positive bacteria)]
TEGDPIILDTTLGRALFNEALPGNYEYIEYQVGKNELGKIVNDLAERYTKVEVANSLDALKDTGFTWATRSGVTVSIEDVVSPKDKLQILEKYEESAAKVQKQFERGLITDDERRQELIEIWTDASNVVAKAMQKNFDQDNPIFMMVNSGARGNWMQVRQIAAMRGLVANPKGDIIPRPIKSNFREGLSVLEYFISTHGARKGLADTALRTADSGYLTRRLVDVSQDVIIREDDCGTERGMPKVIGVVGEDGVVRKDLNAETSAYARNAAVDVVSAAGDVVVEAGGDLGDVQIEELIAAGIAEVKVRSVLTCDAKTGTCAKCYGRSLATGKLVDIGEAVGIIAAQSIGEPGTQLTMRTFHTTGVEGAHRQLRAGLTDR